MKFHFSFCLLLLSFQLAWAQKGTIRGAVIDDNTGEPMIGATVIIDGTSIGTTTDIDGQYSFELEPGNYALKFTYISYKTIEIPSVIVKSAEVTLVENVTLKEDLVETAEVVVQAEAVRSNEAGIINLKLKSAGMIDGISSDKIRQTGDANVAEATKRVTGVTVEGGKYVYVRGLGDRYSKTTLNGVDIPGLDPDKNSLQMDIFPTNLISNIMISKNFTADLPGDFTGGLLNIETKDFPEQQQMGISFSTSFNPQVHFNKNYLSYAASSTDFLGFDNGMRALPSGADNQFIPNPVGYSQDQVRNFNQLFNKTLGAQREMSILDFNGSFSIGNQINLKKKGEPSQNKLGYIFSITHKSDYKFYDDVRFGEYQRDSDASKNEMNYATRQGGELAERSYLMGLIGGIAYKTLHSKLKLSLIHLQNGESRAARLITENNSSAVGQSGYAAISDNLEYNQRSLSNALLQGSHVFVEKAWELDWRVSGTYSSSNDPDIRKTAFSGYDVINPQNSSYRFNAGEAGYPSRIWRSLSEWNATAKMDVQKKWKINGTDLKLKLGASQNYKIRDYSILTFNYVISPNQNYTSSDANQVLNESNLWPGDPSSSGVNVFYIQSGNNSPNSNEYSSNVLNTGAYFSGEYTFFKRLKVIAGLRFEYFLQRHTGRDIANQNRLNNDVVLNTINLFPTVNLVLAITPKMNLRLAYARTVARPSFKELSYAQILDPITNRIFNGSFFRYVNSTGQVTWNGQLTETKIDNADIRWEWFFNNNQLISLTGFFKYFQNPIELIRIPEQQTSSEYQPRNVGNGFVYGFEFEFKKDFAFISPALKNFNINGNFTLVQSIIQMTEVEYNARLSYIRVGESIDRYRDMAGQSPFVINAGMSYTNDEIGMDVGIFYNVKGPTLSIVGTGLSPDIYDEPFHSLNFSFSQKIGKEKKTAIDFKVNNILMDRIESFYVSYQATKQIFNSINPGITFSIGVNHKF